MLEVKIKLAVTEEQYIQLLKMVHLRNNQIAQGQAKMTPLDGLHNDIMMAAKEFFVPKFLERVKAAKKKDRKGA